jgi:hypothetical protein
MPATRTTMPVCRDGFRLLPEDAVLSALLTDFERMLRAGMLFGEQPSFERIITRLRELETKTFELIAETGPEPDDFDVLFATADPDAERALDGAQDAANMPLNEEPQRVIADLNNVRARSEAAAV